MSPPAEQLPRRFGKYQLLSRIAHGGMAELFLARRDGPAGGLEKELVIKRILPAFAQSEEFIALFLNEARLAAMLNHAGVVRIYDLGRAEDTLFIAMEYVDGVNLREVGRALRRMNRVMPARIAAAIGARVAEALDYAHRLKAPNGAALGLVHRDVSADNILLTRDGYVKLVDFGIAKAVAQHPLTLSQGIKGKLNYMAPEQILDESLDGRCDLYALGVTLYLLTTAHFPFGGSNDAAVINLILKADITAPSALVATIPAEFDEIVMRLLAKKREDRFPDGEAASAAMEKFAADAGATLLPRELAEYLEATVLDDSSTARTQTWTAQPTSPPLPPPPPEGERPRISATPQAAREGAASPPRILASPKPDLTADDGAPTPIRPQQAITLVDSGPPLVPTTDKQPALEAASTAEFNPLEPGRRRSLAPAVAGFVLVGCLSGALAWWVMNSRTTAVPPAQPIVISFPVEAAADASVADADAGF